MGNQELFETFKKEIITRAKAANACKDEFARALKAENFNALITVITDNFSFCCRNKVIDCQLLATIGEEVCNNSSLYSNTSSSTGYIIADSATVMAFGSATVEAFGSATVGASDSATVMAFGSATVRASGSATVRAFDSATVEASGSATVRAFDSATVRAFDSATVGASDSATVEAFDSAYIDSRNTIEHKISGKVILRYYHENRIVLGEGLTNN